MPELKDFFRRLRMSVDTSKPEGFGITEKLFNAEFRVSQLGVGYYLAQYFASGPVAFYIGEQEVCCKRGNKLMSTM
jgi:hypothetical protein